MPTKMLIGGDWTDAASGEEIAVIDPATEEVIGSVPRGDREDVDRAVAAASEAFASWRRLSPDERATHLRHGIAAIEGAADELADLLMHEQGKPLMEAKGEVSHLLHGLHFYADLASKVRGAHTDLPGDLGEAYGMVIRRPIGVCAGIVPWNFPLTLLGTKLGPALAAGNTFIAKPAETTPLTTLRIAELLVESGLPEGVCNVVTGYGPEAGEALVAHPDVRRVAFTGESATGQRVMEIAGPQFKRVTLELGGSDPVIVCSDANLAAAVKMITIARYWNAGQGCLAAKRVYVMEDVYDEFVEQMVASVERYEPGEGWTKAERPRLRIGPIHSARQRDELVAQFDDAVKRGATVACGGGIPEGRDRGFFFQPALLTDAPHDSRVATEEVFGPVLPVWKAADLDEAIRLANDTQYGLGSSIWTYDARNIHRAAQEIVAGMTWVNQLHYGYDELPFGGIKASGYGKEHGVEALDHYVELKSVVVGGLG
ncbi:MAG: aldehyde dehydrogenase family protein [Nitriliruptorales bacterium]